MPKASKLIRFLFIILLTTTSIGHVIAQQYNFKRFSVEEGLPRSGVYCLLEDSRGFLWIGTEGGGLARFDGNEFITYTVGNGLADNTIRSLFEDNDGNIWIGTDGHGVCKYDGNEFVTYSSENGLSNDYIRCIAQSTDGDIWLGTFGGGINRLHFDSDSLTVTVFDTGNETLKSNIVRTSLVDKSGKLWFGTDAGLYAKNGSEWQFYNTDSGLSHNRILVLYQDSKEQLWVGTQSGANKMLRNEFVSYSEQDGLAHDRIRGIAQDEIGNMWFGTQNGVSRFDGTDFVTFTEKNGLSNDRIRYIISDRNGNLWFATYFGGICRFSSEEFIHFTEQDGVNSNQVLSIYNNKDGDLWIGTLEGLAELKQQENGTWEIIASPLGKQYAAQSINTSEGNALGEIWFGTNDGILIKDGKKTRLFEADGSRFNENVKAIFFEGDKFVWVGSTQGTTRFRLEDGAYVFDQYHSNPNINKSEVSSFLMDGLGRIWIGYLNKSIVIFEDGEFKNPDLPPTLSNVAAMVNGPLDQVWIATEGSGLFKFEPSLDTISAIDFSAYGVAQGLSSTDLHLLLFDADSNLWAGTASGIDYIQLNSHSEIESVRTYGRAEGFIGSETNENATCVDNHGHLWFGTIKGATRYNFEAKSKSQIEAELHITNVSLEFESVDWTTSTFASGTEGYFNLPTELELPYSYNGITISYKGIDLGNPQQVRYMWKLEGYNDDWSLVEKKNSVSFTNLTPKEYTFKVLSRNANGVWNENPATFTFTILAPFWMQWWFIALCVIAISFIIWSVVRLREKRLLAEKEKLQIMVDDRTKELRSEKERSDELLLNILPLETAEELKEKGYASVQQYNKVSVLFTDFVGFTNITEGITHEELVRSLDEHFRMFDDVMDKYGIEKIKTIGDAYMAAGGIPTRTITNPMAVVAAGLEMIERLEVLNSAKETKGEKAWQLRLGIHTGSVISGVVGKNKFAFDIWGDAVNTAARMESSGEIMKVNISGSTYELIKDYFECTPRGKIKAKNKGEIEMYFVDRLKPEFSENESGLRPNGTFMTILTTS